MATRTIWDRYRALDDRNPYLRMGLVTLVMLVFLGLDINIRPEPGSEYVQEGVLGVILGLLQVLPVIFARKLPLLMLAVIFAAFVGHNALNHQVLWVAQFSSMLTFFLATSQSSDRRSLIAGGMSFAVIVVVFGIMREDVDAVIAISLLFAAVWMVGNVVRSRFRRLEVASRVIADLSEEQERVSREAVVDERARIARELHDILGHTLNLIVIQAGAAQRVFEKTPEKALENLNSIESTGRQALSDVDRLLGILRDPDDSGSNKSPSLEARPSISRLNSLVEETGATGQPVELIISGSPTNIAPSTDLSAYRIVQEALTNVMTHAAGSKARVDIDYSEEFLAVTITNDSTGIDKLKGRRGGGSGVVGMRERTALFGGVFEAGSTDDGGWRVHATFPVGQTRRRDQTGDTK